VPIIYKKRGEAEEGGGGSNIKERLSHRSVVTLTQAHIHTYTEEKKKKGKTRNKEGHTHRLREKGTHLSI
jgi:hypothetical protein